VDVHEPEDPELEQRILADSRPKIFVSGHLGSWEIALAMAAQRVGARGAAIVRPVDNPFINRIFRRIRLSEPGQWIDKRGAAAEALARVRAGESVALLLDENAGHRGVFVDFFGRPASTSKLAALLSLTTGAPIVVGAALRQENRRTFRYRLAVFEPQDVAEEPDAARALTARVVTQWEDWVRQAPLQWRWVHWRWKTRPDGSLETYRRSDVAACFGRQPKRQAR
jgi:KDO2-lipid IV(A) lauroyltransferase